MAQADPVAKSLSDALQKDGHVLVKKAAGADEIGEHRAAISRAVESIAREARPLEDRSTYDKAFLQITNLWQKDDAVKSFVFDKKFAQIAAALLGVEKVRLYHDQALFKEPGGGHTPWHQDKYYWPIDTDNMITMWMPLVDIDAEMGMITFASGSHVNGSVSSLEISDESQRIYDEYVREHDFPIFVPDRMKAGDATFHLGWTVHSAGANASNKMREVMTIIYFADGARITEPASAAQQADLDAWFPRQGPGELAASPLNPVMN